MITKGCCERLGLVQRKSDRMIIGVGNTPVQHSSSTVSVTFCPLNNSEEFSVEAVVTGVLTSEIPNFRLKDPNWPTLKNLKLADPEFYIQAPIDMILGADIYTELMLNGPISLGEGLPMAINTRLGWETESVPSPDLCTQDEDCESLFSNNHGRDSHGRYCVKLPFRQHRPLLGESREKALRRFLLLERKLCKNVKLYDQYRGFMKEYEHLNHMERVPIAEVKRELCRCYYKPHHPVIREQSTTTKMRVVFDASAKSENNVSLNQFLHKGPKIQQDVFFILLRFRTYPVAITADIEKMYRQIRIHPEDADYQRILWRPSPEEPVVDYRLLTVTYGTTSAPFLAMRTLQQLAEDEGQNYPEASRVTLNDFYVDDLLTGAQTIAETKELIDQLKDLMKRGGFHLRKWNSNCHEIVSHVEEMNEEKKINLEKGAISKILGIVWDHVQDTFRVNITLPEEVVTKRDLLSNIARIFDPIGFLSPTTVALKIIMQELWRGGTGWDEHIPNDIKEKWNNFRAELLKLEDLSIPRYVWACEKDRDVQLHGFCDASSVAYSAVCYLRTVSLDGQVHISMLAAKTRVAPCKSLTLPRLELCAALLLSQLYRSVVDSLKIDIGRTYLWSDSQISLSWIKSDPNRWKTFIHNRVVKIQQLSDRNSWRHVSGKDNPADCASRGIMPAALSGHTLWWQGPTWLKDNNFVQNQDNCYGRECHEEEKVALACQSRVSVCPEIVTKYSTFIKTRRIVAWCLRFITNCRVSLKKREIGTLSKKELENAVIRIIGWIQEDEFREEMQDLRNTGHASRKSRILQLNPFIDASGMLRVGGRIQFANVSPDQKFPLLLPKNHHFTKLIILHFHTRYLHAGPQLVLSLIRNSYWIMGGRDIVRRIIKQCITCFRFRAKTAVQIMGNLPADRVNPSRPFTKTGVDLAGPYEIKPSLTRSKGMIKCYVILFVCFSVKAIHLEMVTSLSTSSFIAALRRFISRRGKPSKIYSDNGTNFRGTESFMKKQYKIMNSKETKDFLAEEFIEWHFIPPSAPHFGGLWEANIKCLKGHLSKVIKSSLLNTKEFITLLCQVEACLNSRPLVELSPDPNDLRALTPGHFLIGSPLTEDPGLQNYERVDLRSRWNMVQGLRNSFWSRWTREYINSLQQRNKWRLSQDNLKPNQLVLIKEDNLPPLQWRLARILEVAAPGPPRSLETVGGSWRPPCVGCLPGTGDSSTPPATAIHLVWPSTVTSSTPPATAIHLVWPSTVTNSTPPATAIHLVWPSTVTSSTPPATAIHLVWPSTVTSSTPPATAIHLVWPSTVTNSTPPATAIHLVWPSTVTSSTPPATAIHLVWPSTVTNSTPPATAIHLVWPSTVTSSTPPATAIHLVWPSTVTNSTPPATAIHLVWPSTVTSSTPPATAIHLVWPSTVTSSTPPATAIHLVWPSTVTSSTPPATAIHLVWPSTVTSSTPPATAIHLVWPSTVTSSTPPATAIHLVWPSTVTSSTPPATAIHLVWPSTVTSSTPPATAIHLVWPSTVTSSTPPATAIHLVWPSTVTSSTPPATAIHLVWPSTVTNSTPPATAIHLVWPSTVTSSTPPATAIHLVWPSTVTSSTPPATAIHLVWPSMVTSSTPPATAIDLVWPST
ncbi:hypothetical protein LAZ67_19002378, partial [Cordylochernes scorpioides]